jgi:hypothetical protein
MQHADKLIERIIFLDGSPKLHAANDDATSDNGTKRTTSHVRSSVANGGKPDIARMPNSIENDPPRT